MKSSNLARMCAHLKGYRPALGTLTIGALGAIIASMVLLWQQKEADLEKRKTDYLFETYFNETDSTSMTPREAALAQSQRRLRFALIAPAKDISALNRLAQNGRNCVDSECDEVLITELWLQRSALVDPGEYEDFANLVERELQRRRALALAPGVSRFWLAAPPDHQIVAEDIPIVSSRRVPPLFESEFPTRRFVIAVTLVGSTVIGEGAGATFVCAAKAGVSPQPLIGSSPSFPSYTVTSFQHAPVTKPHSERECFLEAADKSIQELFRTPPNLVRGVKTGPFLPSNASPPSPSS